MKFIVGFDVEGMTEQEILKIDKDLDFECSKKLKEIKNVSGNIPMMEISMEGKFNFKGIDRKYIAVYK
jgi:hypothetical protein